MWKKNKNGQTPLHLFQCIYRPSLLLLIIALFAGCSSGGGSGTASGTFSLQTNQVTFNGDVKVGTPNAAVVNGSLMDPDGDVYIIVDASATPLINNAEVFINGNSGQLYLWPADGGDLGAGTFHGNVVVRACRDAACRSQYQGSPQTIQVTYNVAAPEIDFSTQQLTFNATFQNPTMPPAQTVTLTADASLIPIHGFTLQGGGVEWLQIEFDSKGMTGYAEFTVTIKQALPPGQYETVFNPFLFGRGFAKPVRVTYTVGDNPLVVDASSLTFNISSAATKADAQKIIHVSGTTGGSPMMWEAQTDAPWLSLSKTSGSSATTENIVVSIASDVAYLNSGQYATTIKLNDADAPSVERIIPVTLTLSAPRITAIGPYLGTEDSAAMVSVKGFNLSTVDVASIKIGEAGVQGMEVVSDNLLRIDVPALPAGRYPVYIENAMGVMLSDSEWVVIASPPLAAAEISTNMQLRNIIFDSERNAIYALGPSTSFPMQDVPAKGKVLRYALDNGAWLTSEIPVSDYGLSGLSITPDGRFLTAYASEEDYGVIYAIDLTTLEVAHSFADTTFAHRYLLKAHFYNNRQGLFGMNNYADIDIFAGAISTNPQYSLNEYSAALLIPSNLETIFNFSAYDRSWELQGSILNQNFRFIQNETPVLGGSASASGNRLVYDRKLFQPAESETPTGSFNVETTITADGRYAVGTDNAAKTLLIFDLDSLNSEGNFDQVRELKMDINADFLETIAINLQGDTAILYNHIDTLYIFPLN